MKIQAFLSSIKSNTVSFGKKIFILVGANPLIIQSYKKEIVSLISNYYPAIETEYINANEDHNKSKEILFKLNESSLFYNNKIIIVEDNKGKLPINSLFAIGEPQNFLILQSGKYSYLELQKFKNKIVASKNKDKVKGLKHNFDLITLIEFTKEREIIENLVQYYLKKYINDNYNNLGNNNFNLDNNKEKFHASEISKEENIANTELAIEASEAYLQTEDNFESEDKNIIIEIITDNLVRNNFSIEGEIQKLILYFSTKKKLNSLNRENLKNYYLEQNMECSIKELCKGLFLRHKKDLFTELELFREDEYVLVIRSLLKFVNNIYKFIILFKDCGKEEALAEIKKVPFYDYYIYNYIIELLTNSKDARLRLLETLPKALFHLMLLEKDYKSLSLNKKCLIKERLMEIIILFQKVSPAGNVY